MEGIEYRMKTAGSRIRKVRELKGLTRDEFYESFGENKEYWGLIERGKQSISLPKLLMVCDAYNIPLEEVLGISQEKGIDQQLKQEIIDQLEECTNKQLEIIKKFIDYIAMTI